MGHHLSLFCVAVIGILMIGFAHAQEERGRLLLVHYGNIVTIGDESIASMFKVPGAGVYVVNKKNELVPAVAGGFRMVLSGILGLDWDEFSVGLRGIRAGMFATNTSVFILAVVAVLVVVSIIGLLSHFWGGPRPRTEGKIEGSRQRRLG